MRGNLYMYLYSWVRASETEALHGPVIETMLRWIIVSFYSEMKLLSSAIVLFSCGDLSSSPNECGSRLFVVIAPITGQEGLCSHCRCGTGSHTSHQSVGHQDQSVINPDDRLILICGETHLWLCCGLVLLVSPGRFCSSSALQDGLAAATQSKN